MAAAAASIYRHWELWSGETTGGPAPYLAQYSADTDGSNEYIECPNHSYERTQALTIAFRMKPAAVGVSKYFMGNGFSNGYGGYTFHYSDDRIEVDLYCTVASGGSGFTRVGMALQAEDEWMHVAMTYDGSSNATGMTLYKNGSALSMSGTGTLAGTTASGNSLFVGRGGAAVPAAPEYVNGRWDDLIIFNRALTAGEVAELAAPGVDASSLASYSDCISWYPIGEFGDTIASFQDQKGSNDATPFNMESADIVADVQT